MAMTCEGFRWGSKAIADKVWFCPLPLGCMYQPLRKMPLCRLPFKEVTHSQS